MRRLPLLALSASLVTLTACESSTGNDGETLQYTGVLDSFGSASVALPREAGSPNNPPGVTCATADPSVPAENRAWFFFSSVQLPGPNGEVLSNCIVEPSFDDPSRLVATIEGEEPGWLYSIRVFY